MRSNNSTNKTVILALFYVFLVEACHFIILDVQPRCELNSEPVALEPDIFMGLLYGF